jgi:hypothetical protein
MANSVKKSVLGRTNPKAWSTKASFNETTYEFVFDTIIETSTDEVRSRYKILINGKVDSRFLLVSTMFDEPQACYKVLVPSTQPGAYSTPYNQYYEKGFPMYIVFDIVKFLNKPNNQATTKEFLNHLFNKK